MRWAVVYTLNTRILIWKYYSKSIDRLPMSRKVFVKTRSVSGLSDVTKITVFVRKHDQGKLDGLKSLASGATVYLNCSLSNQFSTSRAIQINHKIQPVKSRSLESLNNWTPTVSQLVHRVHFLFRNIESVISWIGWNKFEKGKPY